MEGSGVDPAIVSLNVRSLSEDVAFSFVLYSEKLDRINTGRLSARWLKQYDHLYEGGWWVSGIDPDDPYHPMTWGRFKPDKPRVELRNGKARAIKYENPPQEETRAVFLDVPRDVLKQVARRYDLQVPLGSVAFWQWVKENDVPVVLVEGAKKAGALLSLGYAAVALPGAWNGTRADEAGMPQLIPDLQWMASGGRQVMLALDNDSNPSTRRMVNRAFARMGAAFRERSCRVYVAEIEGEEKGIDDLLVARGAEAVERVLARAERFEGWASKRGLRNAALWWEVYSRGQQGNLLERAQQAAFAAFRDGRTIPDVVEMLSKVPEYRHAATSDRFEPAREFGSTPTKVRKLS